MHKTFFVICIGLGIWSFPRFAEATSSSRVLNSSEWSTKTDFTMNVRAFGYAPATIVSPDGKMRADSQHILQHRADFRLRLFIYGKYLRLEAKPYTVTPVSEGGGYRVSLAGLEISLLAVLNNSLRVGLYHHSAHNFSFGGFGKGIDLNALVVDSDLLRGTIGVVGAEYLIRGRVQYFISDTASPYVFTENTNVASADIGNLKWRARTEIDVRDNHGRLTQCSFVVSATDHALASFVGECGVLFTPGPSFFGVFGEHFSLGPYLYYGQNIGRIEHFGLNAFMVGLRMRLNAFENHNDLKFR